MGKDVYTLPHRINESLGTQELIKKGLIKVIYDIDEFIYNISGVRNKLFEEMENIYVSMPLSLFIFII
jgi:predicted Rossmann fold nucleotide-binding protein DprA/Smf involved in DNA uptake